MVGYNGVQKYREEQILKEVNKTFGQIEDFSGATKPQIKLGHGENGFTVGTPSGVAFADELNEPKLKVLLKNNKLFVSTIVRAFDGHLIAVINNNEWELIDKSQVDYNNNDTSFEVVSKGLHKVYFQVELINGAAHVTGLLVSEKGNGWYFYSDPTTQAGLMGLVKADSTFDIPETAQPIFKYPREGHLGERAK